MKRLAGVLCALLGVILLVGGYVASWYMVRKPLHPHYPALVDTYPYQYLAFPLIVLGVILIVAGVFLYFYARPKPLGHVRTQK